MEEPPRKLHLLVAATGPRDTSFALTLVVRLSRNPKVEIRAIVDDVVPRLTRMITVIPNQSLAFGPFERAGSIEFYRQQAYELVEWADVMVCVPLGADAIAKLLNGISDTLLGKVLRAWDTANAVVMAPGMSTHTFTNPMTEKQLSKIDRKWKWIKTVTPILWHYEFHEGMAGPRRVINWSGFDEVLTAIQNQVVLLGLAHDISVAPETPAFISRGKVRAKLPPEIWSIILDYTGDWELATALGIYTNLPMAPSWRLLPRDLTNPSLVYQHELEWAVLTGSSAAVCRKISQSPANFRELPGLAVKIILKFGLIQVLAYLEANRPELFDVFDGRFLPERASVVFPRTDVLDYWKESRWFRDRHTWDAEAVNGASRRGNTEVLEWWWRCSGFSMRYTETALEKASSFGHLRVLEWWRTAAALDEKLVLRPGKSLLSATLQGRTEVLRWWHTSGIPVAYADSVAKTASQAGRVEVLETWRQLKGDQFIFDAEILVGPTKYRHVKVLEWWRQYANGELAGMGGRKRVVEYRTCDIDTALRSYRPTENEGQAKVREWWERNGLDSGLDDKQKLEIRHL